MTVSRRNERCGRCPLCVKHDRLRHVDAVERAPRVLPQQLPVSTVSPIARRAVTTRIWRTPPSVTSIGDVYRCFVVQRFPDRCAGRLVVGHDRAATRAARAAQSTLSSTMSGEADMPQVRLAAPILGQDVPPPHERARRRIEHAQLAFGAERVDAPFVIGRRRSRAVATHRLLEARLPAVGPELAAASARRRPRRLPDCAAARS